MNETNHVQGVSCSVTDCVHNAHDSVCKAKHIQVINEERNCDEKTDTFCNTFTAR